MASHSKLTPEHLALELVREPEVAAYLEARGTSLAQVESALHRCIAAVEVRPGEVETEAASSLQRIVQTAIRRTEVDGREYLMVRDLLLAVVDARETLASAAILDATQDATVFEELRTYRAADERRAV